MSYTIKVLRTKAKNAGLRSYSRLNKSELISYLQKKYVLSILDTPIPNINTPILKPTPYKPPVQPQKSPPQTNWSFLDKPIPPPRRSKRLRDLQKIVAEASYKKPFEIIEIESALDRFTTNYKIEGRPGYNPKMFLEDVKKSVVDLLTKKRNTKSKITLRCMMSKQDLNTGKKIIKEAAFSSSSSQNSSVIEEGTDISSLYDEWMMKILEDISSFQETGSGWRFESIVNLTIYTISYEPLRGSSYIKLPDYLANKKALINLKNKDNQCFKYAVTRGINPVDKNAERIDKGLREQANKLNWNGISFPTPIKDIDIFERNNPTVSINVLGYNDIDKEYNQYKEEIYPLRTSKYDRKHKVDLLLISNEENQHYCIIKNMSRLLYEQKYTKHQKKYYCRRCFSSFTSQEKLKLHKESCNQHETVKIEMPSDEKSNQSFCNYFKSQKVPFVIYADFECFTKPIDTCQPSSKESYTMKYQRHEPSGFCYYIKCIDDEIYSQDPVKFTKTKDDQDVAAIFVEKITENIKRIYQKFKFEKKLKISKEEEKIFQKSIECHICKKPFEDNDKKVRDHCHFTGHFRGAAHNKCNLAYRKPKFIPVIFHNLAGYDAHIFVKNLGESEGKINCIPNNEERYISFTKQIVVGSFIPKSERTDEDGKCHVCKKPVTSEDDENYTVIHKQYKTKKVLGLAHKKCTLVEIKRDIRFIDSFKFMASGLDKLVNNLEEKDCLNVQKYYQNEKLKLLLRKGVFPYDYVNSLKRLQETELPPKEAFYSKLNDDQISEDNYQHAQNVWKTFKMKNMRDYHDLYLQSDVLLLADVFENFRKVCMKNYQLDPAWYYTAPGLSYDAMLKKTEINLQLLQDVDMLLMIENGVRGGVSMIAKRYAEANNKYMEDDYDPSKPTKYIQYLDANNLYGWAMSNPLPIANFTWMNQSELKNWKEHPCILEVDMAYPKELHKMHDDYPLAPEKIKINKVEKLIPRLENKNKYVIHHKSLKQYERLGLKITKIHRGIKFTERDFMKQYIDLNTELRKKATSDFEKDFFKLMNNSVFGKTIENLRKRVDIHLVNSRKKAHKLVTKPNFDRCTIFDENLIAIHMKKTKLIMNKPIYLGMSILDISKTKMYDFHYDYIKPKYGDEAKLLMTDSVTDDTPVLVKDENDNIFIRSIDNLTKKYETRRDGKEYGKTNYKVWSDGGWNEIKNVIRHEVNKDIYRVSTKTGSVCVTKDHSLLDHLGNKIKPTDCKPKETKMLTGHPIHNSFRNIKLDQILYDIDDEEVERTIEEKKAFVYGFFYADGSCGTYQTKSGIKRNWALNNQNLKYLETCKKYLEDLNYKSKIYNTIKSSGVYKLIALRPKDIVDEYRPQFYDERKFKKIPDYVLNSDYNVRYNFFLGYYMGDGCKTKTRPNVRFCNKGQIGSAQLYYLARSIGLRPRLNVRKDKPSIYNMDCARGKRTGLPDNVVTKIESYKYEGKFVYDLETVNGTFQAGVGEIIVHNTDSLVYEIQTEDFYKDISPDINKHFDTSNYSKDHPSRIPTGLNKKKLGVFKDEAGGKIIEKFVGLRSKLYSFKIGNEEEKKCKGVKKCIVKKQITFNDYVKCLYTEEPQYRSMNVIRSYNHNMYSETVNKKALDCFDDKRTILSDKVHTHSLGYKPI